MNRLNNLTGLIVVTAALMGGCSTTSSRTPSSTGLDPVDVTPVPTTVVLVDDVEWQDLNPARGDQSPRAGTLWGDRMGTQATGYLLRPVDGFRSPPHIHNVTYRAVVIGGLLHNADADAEDRWMPAGSFWTQPKGSPHITAAEGKDTMAYVEIDEGPYLVHPVEQAFEAPEKPLNVHAANIVWVPVHGFEQSAPRVAVSYLWGEPVQGQLHGLFVRLPAGTSAVLSAKESDMHAVVVQGTVNLTVLDTPSPRALSPGSLFSSEGDALHPVACGPGPDCILYVRSQGAVTIRQPDGV